jgi:hypothetical protein
VETENWTLPWLNDFRQSTGQGIFNAGDAVVSLRMSCGSPAQGEVDVRNVGLAPLPAGLPVSVYKSEGQSNTSVATLYTTHALLPNQTEPITFTVPASVGNDTDTYGAEVVDVPGTSNFVECNTQNNAAEAPPIACEQ